MRQTALIILTIFFMADCFAQADTSAFRGTIYRINKNVPNSSYANYEFYILSDSTSYLRGFYSDTSTYLIYKGKLKHISDTLYEFNYRPIVTFFYKEDKYWVTDIVTFFITQIDTTLPTFLYKIKAKGDNWQTINLSGHKSKIYIKDVNEQKLVLDTKFIDPLTNKNINVTAYRNLAPDLTYYGAKSKPSTLKIIIIKNKMTIYPDRKYYYRKDDLILSK